MNTKSIMANELRHIAKEIIRTMEGSLETSQYWGLRLRLIADQLDAPKPTPEPDIEEARRSNLSAYWDFFIKKYKEHLPYLALPIVLEAFYFFAREDNIHRCEVILGIHS